MKKLTVLQVHLHHHVTGSVLVTTFLIKLYPEVSFRVFLKAELLDFLDHQVREKMLETTRDLVASDILEGTCQVGDRAPEFILGDSGGVFYQSRDLYEKGWLLVSFYRGIW